MQKLGDYLESATKSLFRFEYLQDFSGGEDGRAFARWQANKTMDWEMLHPWWDFMERKRKQGVEMVRVRLVQYPMSEYTKFELRIHRESTHHGDDIRGITEDRFRKLGITQTDFWLIDDSLVIQMLYGNKGKFEGVELLKGQEDEYRRTKQKLIDASVPIEQIPVW